MSDGILSQKEIDALLGGTTPDDHDEIDLDAIGRVLAAVVEPWVLTLSETFQATTVELETFLLDGFESLAHQMGQAVFVELQLEAGFPGAAFLLVPADAVAHIGAAALGQDPQSIELTDDVLQALANTLEKARGEMVTSLSEVMGTEVDVGLSRPVPVDLEGAEQSDRVLPLEEEVFQAKYAVRAGDLNFKAFVQMPRAVAPGILSVLATANDLEGDAGSGMFQAEIAKELPEVEEAGKASVQEAHFGELGVASPQKEHSNLDFLLDVPLQVTVELGRTSMQIRNVLDLGKGSVVELEKLAGEPVEVFVNGKLIAKGEVVTIDENFGVKIVEIVSKAERVHSLR